MIVLFGHYQEMRPNEENAKIALEIHKAQGYGQLTGGWGDPSAPDMLRAYSLAFGVDILGPRQSAHWGHETVKRWLQYSRRRDRVAWSSPGTVPGELLVEMSQYEKHEPGKGAHHGLDGLRYFYAGWQGGR